MHGRCLNCIRLKKDCHFYPVDQGPGESKARPSDSGSKQKAPSDHSSPRTSTASDSVEDMTKFQGQQAQGTHSIHSSKQSSELDFTESPLDGGQYQDGCDATGLTPLAEPFNSPTFSYAGMTDNSPWGTTTFFGSQQSMNEDPNTPQSGTEYWPPMLPPSSTMFQHRGSIPGVMDQQQQQSVFVPSNDHPHNWTAMRSMSVGDMSHSINQFQQSLHAQRHGGYPTSTYPYNFSAQSTGASMIASPAHSLTMPVTASSILPSQPLPLNSQPVSQGWTAYADQSTPVAEHNPTFFGGPQWYSDGPSMGGLDENSIITTDGEFTPTTAPG